MAYITFSDSDEIEHLHNPHLFGRNNPAADSSLNNELISRNHASIEWLDGEWLIQDFSRNGTWVNGKQLRQHTPKKLNLDDTVQLGNDDSSGVSFKVCQLEKPQDLIYRPYPTLQIIPIDKNNLIPNATSPDFGLFYCQDKNGWFTQEFNAESKPIKELETGPHYHGNEILCAGNRWKLFLLNHDKSTPAKKTNTMPHINDVEFQVAFNRTEDNIRLALITKDTELKLEQQSYNKLVAQLINLQQQSSDGWVTFQDLSKAANKNQTSINLQLFLLKRDISSHLKNHKGVSKLINLKQNSLRLGINNYSIYRNGKLDQTSDFHL